MVAEISNCFKTINWSSIREINGQITSVKPEKEKSTFSFIPPPEQVSTSHLLYHNLRALPINSD